MSEAFGTTPDGETVYRISLSGGGLTAAVLTWGGILQDLRLAGHSAPLVLGFPTLEPYLQHPLYMGAVVGRYANRIANGRFELGGRTFEIDNGGVPGHVLHGGTRGFDRRNWTIADHGADFVVLTYFFARWRNGFSWKSERGLHVPADRRGAASCGDGSDK